MAVHRPGSESTSSTHRSDRSSLSSQSLMQDLNLRRVALCRSWSRSRSNALRSVTILHGSLMNRRPGPEALRGCVHLRLELLIGPEMLTRNDRLRAKLGLEGRVPAHCFRSRRLVDGELFPGQVEA
jgi:hypothetical protein